MIDVEVGFKGWCRYCGKNIGKAFSYKKVKDKLAKHESECPSNPVNRNCLNCVIYKDGNCKKSKRKKNLSSTANCWDWKPIINKKGDKNEKET